MGNNVLCLGGVHPKKKRENDLNHNNTKGGVGVLS